MNSQLRQLKQRRTIRAKNIKHLVQQLPEKLETMRVKSFVTRGMSSTPCLMQAKGRRPNKYRMYIPNVSLAE